MTLIINEKVLISIQVFTKEPFCLSLTLSMSKYYDIFSHGSRYKTIENYVISAKCPCFSFYMCYSVCLLHLISF